MLSVFIIQKNIVVLLIIYVVSKCDRACKNRARGHKLNPVSLKVISQYWNTLFHSVTSIIMPNTFALSAEIIITIECWYKKL